MINIFTIATDVYGQYLPTLKKSLANFNPQEQIRFILLADKPYIDYDIYYHICNLQYPFNTFHKVDYIIDCINEFDIDKNEYFIYVDADTCFRKMPEQFWNNTFSSIMNSDKLCFACSPWKFTNILFENDLSKDSCPEAYVSNKPIQWIQASFFMGPINKLFDKFYNEWNKIITNCIKNHRDYPVLPHMFDQSVINKILSLNYDDYIIDDFIFNGYGMNLLYNDEYLISDFSDKNLINCKCTYSLNDYPNIFLFQKFNNEIKLSKRL